MTKHFATLQEAIEELKSNFRAKFGQFYVSVDSKTRAIRVVDIENGIKVNGEDGSLIECVASSDIEKWIVPLLTQVWLSSQQATLEKCVEEIKWMKEEGRVGYPWIHDGARMCERFDKLLASLSDYQQKIKEVK